MALAVATISLALGVLGTALLVGVRRGWPSPWPQSRSRWACSGRRCGVAEQDAEKRLIVELDCPCGACLLIDYRLNMSIAEHLIRLAENWSNAHSTHPASTVAREPPR